MKRVLIVDDSPTMRRMIMSSLRSIPEAEFTEASNGLEAIEKLSLGPMALMVLDLNMPDMHGLDVLQFLRSHEPFKYLPVIVLTTKDDDESRKGAMDAGATLYLTKPFQPHTLLDNAMRVLQEVKTRS
jgi:two-component system, chemotaxis family, chemotaxis protein CheY